MPKKKARPPQAGDGSSEKVLAGLAKISTLLEDVFILQACRAGMKHQEIRAILHIDIRRVTRIGRHVKEERE